MTKPLLVGTLLVVLLSLNALADTSETQVPSRDWTKISDDVAKIKKLIPAGEEIAGAYAKDYDQTTQKFVEKLLTGNDYLNAVAEKYAFADLNGDGKLDLVVTTEDAPTSDANGVILGNRALLVYLADEAGNLKLFTEGKKAVLGGEDGGAFGDPLNGLKVKNRVITIDFYGGSADRWAIVFLIGRTDSGFNSISLVGSSVDTDLLTGNQITTIMRGERPKLYKRKLVPIKPLVRLSDAKAVED